MDHIDTCIIGAGVIGLAIARKLAMDGAETLVLEKSAHYGQGISSRNSEVIHAGLYYDKNSLKSRLCQLGLRMLYDYCETRVVGYQRCGKLVVSSSASEDETLFNLFNRAEDNGVGGLALCSKAQIRTMEPAIEASCGFHSPATGIVSAHELMDAFAADIDNHNGQLVLNSEVISITRTNIGFQLKVNTGSDTFEFTCRRLINSAGLDAVNLSRRCDFIEAGGLPRLYFCKGSYLSYAGKSPFSRLIYPVPEKSGAGLGVHSTLDLGGQLKFGPDVEYLDADSVQDSDYQVNPDRIEDFYQSVKRYFPGLDRSKLSLGYVGIRPKLQGPNDPVQDFEIQGEHQHGIRGYVQLFGMESPGLTSSMAIGDYVAKLLSTDE